ncbi:TRAP transporter substrate-binding protein DctP [Chelativorans alearense]|uniref:TRAP transporter substrate-binding protein DctP n=1 Tax=Chelativorans alearense TaxID=2681495 RepID=UPI0013D518A3|nr:TRAP transporter substrate-binding protein DctP [Chelativorans alearense]
MSVLTAGSAPADEVTLKAVGAFNTSAGVSAPFRNFIDWVNENGKGVVQIRFLGGPETIPPFELGGAISSGVVDVGFAPHAFYANILPGAAMVKLATNTGQEQRRNGCYEKLDTLHQERMNVKYLGRTGDRIQYHLYLNKRHDSADLSGLTIRVTPIYQAMFGSLNANMVNTPPGDVYAALERGAVQGYGWPSIGIFDLGWQDHTKYRVDPGFYQQDVNILVNLDKWKSLTDEQRAVFGEAMDVAEAAEANNEALVKAEKKKHAEAGIETIELTGDDRGTWLAAAAETARTEIAKSDAAAVELLIDCLTSAR